MTEMKYYLLLACNLVMTFAFSPLRASASTMELEHGFGTPGDTAVSMAVSLDNASGWGGFECIIEFDAALLTLSRIDLTSRLSMLSDVSHYEYAAGRVSIVGFDLGGSSIPSDTGAILNLRFDVLSSAPFGETPIVISDVAAVQTDMQYDTVDVVDATFYVWPGYFCGDVDGDLSIDPNISDLVFLVNFMFQGGPEPPVMEATDVNCTGGGTPDISDLVYLVSYMFQSGPDLNCPPCKGTSVGSTDQIIAGTCDIIPVALEEGRYRFDLATDLKIDLGGLQQVYTYDPNVVAIDSVVSGAVGDGIEIFSHAEAGTVTIGMLDTEGEHAIEAGQTDLLRIYCHLLDPEVAPDDVLDHSMTKAADRKAQPVSLQVTSDKKSDMLPRTYALHHNYPNPFNPSTTIKFDLPRPGHVTLEVYNLLGQRVTTLVDGNLEAGYHQVRWDGTNHQGGVVASGVYFYKIQADGFARSRKMVLLK